MPAKKKWIAGAVSAHPGALHRALGISTKKTIPAGTLAAAAKKPGLMGRRARLAKTLKRMR